MDYRLLTLEHAGAGPPWPVDAGVDLVIPVAPEAVTHSPGPGDVVVCRGRYTDGGETLDLVWTRPDGTTGCALDMPAWLRWMGVEAYRPEHRRPLSARLPINYHRIPGSLRFLAASLLMRRSGDRAAATFPVSEHNCGTELLLWLLRDESGAEGPGPTVILSHDIELGEDFGRIPAIADLERSLGFRSGWNVVPDRYPLDEKVLGALLDQGHEVGLHGLRHDTREAFLPLDVMHRRYADLSPLLRRFGIRGFRSPSWYRTARLFDVLEEYFDYDMSCLDNDLVCPGGPGGTGLGRPFHIRPGLVEIPCTLPYEAPTYRGIAPEAWFDHWRPKIDSIASLGGCLTVCTHPDRNYGGNEQARRAYVTLLEHLADKGWRCVLPKDAVAEAMP